MLRPTTQCANSVSAAMESASALTHDAVTGCGNRRVISPARPAAAVLARRRRRCGLPRRCGGPRRRPSRPTPARPAACAMQRPAGPCRDGSVRPRQCPQKGGFIAFGGEKRSHGLITDPQRNTSGKRRDLRQSTTGLVTVRGNQEKPPRSSGTSTDWFAESIGPPITRRGACAAASRHTDRLTPASPTR